MTNAIPLLKAPGYPALQADLYKEYPKRFHMVHVYVYHWMEKLTEMIHIKFSEIILLLLRSTCLSFCKIWCFIWGNWDIKVNFNENKPYYKESVNQRLPTNFRNYLALINTTFDTQTAILYQTDAEDWLQMNFLERWKNSLYYSSL